MYTPTINNFGIEGDDLPYHLGLLGANADLFNQRIWFFPLVDHYNTHGPNWLEQQAVRAGLADVVVFYDLVHTDDYVHYKNTVFIDSFFHTNKCWLTVNQSPQLYENITVIPWDFMWNRFKAYYTEKIPENLYLHHYSYGKYQLPRLDINQPKTKKFLSLCGREFSFRKPLYEFVSQFANDGYISNRSRGQFLENIPIIGAFNPVPLNFYQDTCLSIYAESNFINRGLIHITEKTYEPLVKGHFILPFSNVNTIKRLKEIGFEFPGFIDYSYDNEKDPDIRFKMLCEEFVRLMKLDLSTLWKENFELLIHNQQCIQTIPYDRRILKLYDI